MKNKFILLVAAMCLFASSVSAQSISFNFNDVHIGRNLSVLYQNGSVAHQYYAGIKYHLHRYPIYNGVNREYKKQFHAFNLSQRLGLQAGYRFYIPINPRTSVFAFYDLQLSRCGRKRVRFEPVGTVNEEIVYTQLEQDLYPNNIWEQYAGVGIQTDIKFGVFLSARYGLGTAFYWGIPDEIAPDLPRTGPPQRWEFARQLSFGLGYRIK